MQPTVADEVEHLLFYMSEVIYSIVPSLFESLRAAFEDAYGPGEEAAAPWPIVRFGSWVGGDMDGNSNVSAETIRATLRRQRQLILARYSADVRQLFDRLSQSISRVSVAEAVRERCRTYRDSMSCSMSERIPRRYDEMPYRVLLWLMRERLEATRDDRPGGYEGAHEFRDDVQLIADSLRANRGANAGLARVEALLRCVETFGFCLVTLDIREDARVHREVAARVLGVADFSKQPAAERARHLRNALEVTRAIPSDNLEPLSKRTLDVLSAISEERSRYGSQAIGPYIISMAGGADDALAVLFLARCADLVDAGGNVPLDIAPLFETVGDLDRAHETLGALLSDGHYRTHLESRNDEQVVMLGYSDSSKISGLVASRWALYRAQERLVEQCDAAGVRLTVFHGRGGTAGRGGSKPRAGILADPCSAVRGRVRVTEQGEVINLKYGVPDIAERTLELMTGAVLEATAFCDLKSFPAQRWVEAMDTVATAGRTAYHALVHEDSDFVTCFREATPVDLVERLRIGSRPPSPGSGKGVENLRAIPWVFAWTQSRHMFQGWYGVGAGLRRARELHGERVLCEMARDWPFFASLLADVEMVLAKADMGIAARYAALAGPVGERIFPIIRDQFDETVRMVTELKGADDVLDGEPRLKRSIRLRNPYVDPMSLVQVDLLRRWREGGRKDTRLEQALFTTVRGLARGLRNTG